MLNKLASISWVLLFFLLFVGACSEHEEDESVVEFEMEEKPKCWVLVDGVFEYIVLFDRPEYIDGGKEGFYSMLQINYPHEARENNIQGQVVVDFQIMVTGEVDSVVIIQDIGAGCGDAVREAIINATEGISFHPAMLDGEAVQVKKNLPVRFKLQ